MRVGLVSILLLTAGVAHAEERRTAIDLQAGVGPVMTADEYDYDPATATILRARFGWEGDRVPYPAEPGYAWGGSFVPELTLGMIDHEEQGEGFVQAGLRLEARFAQKEQGLLRVSAQGGMWLAGRAGVLGEYRDTIWEGAIGWYLWLGKSKLRIGTELSLMGIEGEASDTAQPLPGGAIGFDTGSTDKASTFQFSVFLGGRL